MTVTLLSNVGTRTIPDAIAYESEQVSANVVHRVMGSGAPVVTVGPLGMRRGRLDLYCPDYPTALAVAGLHAGSGTWVRATWTDTELAGIAMTYVLDTGGSVVVHPAEVGLAPWVVVVDYQEVVPP
jgi:hypothetical protein